MSYINLLSTSSEISFCDSSGGLRTLLVINIIMTVIKVVVPLLLIITAIVSYSKAAVAGSPQDELKKATQMLLKKSVAAILVFVLPSFFSSMFNMLTSYEEVENEFLGCKVCFSGDSNCKTLIEVAQVEEIELAEAEMRNQAEEVSELGKKKKEQEVLREQALNEYKKEQRERNQQSSAGAQPTDGVTVAANVDLSKNGITLDWGNVTKISGLTASELVKALNAKGGKAVNFVPYASDLIAAEKKHSVNVFYLIAIDALESGWVTSNLAVNCNNLGGVKYSGQSYGNGKKTTRCGSGDFARYDSVGEFIDYHANLLEKNYLTPGGSYYEGTSPDAVVIHYCPGGGTTYTDSIRSIGTSIFNAAVGG